MTYHYGDLVTERTKIPAMGVTQLNTGLNFGPINCYATLPTVLFHPHSQGSSPGFWLPGPQAKAKAAQKPRIWLGLALRATALASWLFGLKPSHGHHYFRVSGTALYTVSKFVGILGDCKDCKDVRMKRR